jgi:hypothetical protein
MVPITFELLCPIIQVMNLIQQQNRRRAASAGFGVGSTTLPKSGKRRVWFIASGVDCGIAKLGGDFKQQRGLANLPRPREKLDSAWRGFSEAFQEEIPARYIVICEFRHNRIIIQIYLKNVKKLKQARTVPVTRQSKKNSAPIDRFRIQWLFAAENLVATIDGFAQIQGFKYVFAAVVRILITATYRFFGSSFRGKRFRDGLLSHCRPDVRSLHDPAA